MGCYNTIYFHCPFCGEEIQEQSKGGSCTLSCKDIDKADLEDILAVSNSPITCSGCSKTLIINTKVKRTISISEYDPIEYEDFDE